MSFRAPKGTDDILPPASRRWRRVLQTFDQLAERYGYDPAMTPIFEATDLFARGVGEGTDVVQKQMYTFEDQGGRSLTLRPEATAPIVRAYIDSGARGVLKLSYSGPMFRYERPQAGRRRQFWQVGIEYLGEDSAEADVEVMELGYRFYQAIGIADFEVKLNSLGDPESRVVYRAALVEYLESIADDLSEDSRQRIDSNPLRVLDSKVDRDKLTDVPVPLDYLTPDAATHYQIVKDGLTRLGIPYSEDPRLVRGLDYYTRTVFEYASQTLEAAQNALGGGGRYDGLAEALGGPHVPAVGFSLGIDRTLLDLDEPDEAPALDAFIVVADEARWEQALGLLAELRSAGIRSDLDLGRRSVKAQFKAADRRRSAAAVVVGDEWDEDQVTAKNLLTGSEERVARDKIAAWLQSLDG